jgi:hypothetical protein
MAKIRNNTPGRYVLTWQDKTKADREIVIGPKLPQQVAAELKDAIEPHEITVSAEDLKAIRESKIAGDLLKALCAPAEDGAEPALSLYE